ncbi:MAG: DNA polymerase III subunit delta [Deltaproteobacteria bacterium]|nr:MAG: DNA polymerase III subunit delta [Deltaproteobacteria bacterium]
MQRDVKPEELLKRLETGTLSPYYLFYGPSEFLKENVLMQIRNRALAPGTRDFNLQVFYGDEASPGQVLEAARSLPFMAERRMVIVRRAEGFKKADQKDFLPYLETPVPSTYLIFLASNVDFRQPLFSKIREAGRAVHFAPLREGQIVPWLRSVARDMGLRISREACAYLHQIAGNSLMDLYGELEKLSLRYGDNPIGIEQVRETAINSKAYNIFELVDRVSEKRCASALQVLHRLLQQGGRDSALGIIGMLNRQFRLLWQTKWMKAQGQAQEVAKKLGIPPFSARKLLEQSENWSEGQLREFLESLYQADSRIKSGSQEEIILENVIISLCKGKHQEESWFTRR